MKYKEILDEIKLLLNEDDFFSDKMIISHINSSINALSNLITAENDNFYLTFHIYNVSYNGDFDLPDNFKIASYIEYSVNNNIYNLPIYSFKKNSQYNFPFAFLMNNKICFRYLSFFGDYKFYYFRNIATVDVNNPLLSLHLDDVLEQNIDLPDYVYNLLIYFVLLRLSINSKEFNNIIAELYKEEKDKLINLLRLKNKNSSVNIKNMKFYF